MVNDVAVDGQRTLPPFLSTRYVLRLSECCHPLQPFRSLLSDICLPKYPYSRDGAHVMPLHTLSSMLRVQRCPRSIRINHWAYVYCVMHVVWSNAQYGAHVKVLDVSGMPTIVEAEPIVEIVTALRALEDLDLRVERLPDGILMDIVQRALCCRGLKALRINAVSDIPGDTMLANMVRGRRFDSMENLQIRGMNDENECEQYGNFISAIGTGCFPNLTRFVVDNISCSDIGDSEPLYDALSSCRKLARICLDNCSSNSLTQAIRAMGHGYMENLLHLNISHSVEFGINHAHALAGALPLCPLLQSFVAKNVYMSSSDMVMPILEAMPRSVVCLDMESNSIRSRACEYIGDSVAARRYEHLEVLSLRGSVSTDVVAVSALIAGLSGSSIRSLDLRRTGNNGYGAQSVITCGPISGMANLRSICMGPSDGFTTTAFTELMVAVMHCPLVEEIRVRGLLGGSGGLASDDAVCGALSELPRLRVFDVRHFYGFTANTYGALARCTRLEELCLVNIRMWKEDAHVLAGSLPHLQRLRIFNVSANPRLNGRLGVPSATDIPADVVMADLFDALPSSLVVLNVSNAGLDSFGRSLVAESLARLVDRTLLRKLLLHDNKGFSAECVITVLRAIREQHVDLKDVRVDVGDRPEVMEVCQSVENLNGQLRDNVAMFARIHGL